MVRDEKFILNTCRLRQETSDYTHNVKLAAKRVKVYKYRLTSFSLTKTSHGNTNFKELVNNSTRTSP